VEYYIFLLSSAWLLTMSGESSRGPANSQGPIKYPDLMSFFWYLLTGLSWKKSRKMVVVCVTSD